MGFKNHRKPCVDNLDLMLLYMYVYVFALKYLLYTYLLLKIIDESLFSVKLYFNLIFFIISFNIEWHIMLSINLYIIQK